MLSCRAVAPLMSMKQTKIVATVGPASGLERIGYVLGRWPDLATEVLFDGAWLVIAALALPIAFALRVRDVRRFASTALLLGAAYVAALAWTPHNLEWHVTTATPRLLQHLAPLGLLAAFAAAAHFLAPVPRRIIQRGILADESKR